MSSVMGYVTFNSYDEAEKVCESLVSQKLIACANILPAHTSLYTWKGKSERTREFAATLKTKKALCSEVIAFIKANHSYETPCIVFWDITDGSPDFLNWVRTQTR